MHADGKTRVESPSPEWSAEEYRARLRLFREKLSILNEQASDLLAEARRLCLAAEGTKL